ncbi:P-loop containing nucleoside triphosphate hydrolase protein, partial [Dendrothele bispora CBS 962.96]
TVLSVDAIGDQAEQHFGFRPCMPQLLSAWHQLQGKTVFTIARTGFGKTLTFWTTLLAHTKTKSNGILLIVTPLNILGDKNAREAMERLGLSGINVTGDEAKPEVFKNIAELHYQVIVASPELLVEHEGFRALFSNTEFTSCLINVTFDEAHCIILWSGKDFRPQYKQTHKLRWYIPDKVPYHFVSATLPRNIQDEIMQLFNLQKGDEVVEVRLSNDRPNIHLQVVEMKHSQTQKRDLKRVLRLDGDDRPPKFMVFCNKRKETEDIVKRMWEDLAPQYREKIVWFHSGMSDEFQESRMQMLTEGKIWGIVCTDAAGMGLDVPDIELVVQWGYIDSLCTLAQRLGRGGRSLLCEARGVYLVESQYFDATKAAKAERARKREEAKAQK